MPGDRHTVFEIGFSSAANSVDFSRDWNQGNFVQRITISIEDALAEAFDAYLAERGYSSRSEGIRDIVRDFMERDREAHASHENSAANLSYIYQHRLRSLASRLSTMQHDHHDLVFSSTLVPLDHEYSFETVLLKGPTKELQAFADMVRSQRGIRSVVLNLVGVTPGDHHSHPGNHRHAGHAHLSPTIP